MNLSVWRVFNGYVGNGAVHRIVVAFTAEGAVNLAAAAGMKVGSSPMEAVMVLSTADRGCEAEDFDG